MLVVLIPPLTMAAAWRSRVSAAWAAEKNPANWSAAEACDWPEGVAVADALGLPPVVAGADDEMYETEASPQMLALAHERGGFLLIVTQAVAPACLDADALTCALASPMTVTCRIALPIRKGRVMQQQATGSG